MNERRRFPRYPFVAYTEVTELKPPHVQIKARTSDLSREGCYVDTITPFDRGTQVLVKIMKNERTFVAKGVVLYAVVGMGMGVHFTSIQPAEIPVIEIWIPELNGEVLETSSEGDPDDTQSLMGQLETILDKLSKKRLY